MLDPISTDTAMTLTLREVAIGAVSLVSAIVSLAAGYRKFLQIRRDVDGLLKWRDKASPLLKRLRDVELVRRATGEASSDDVPVQRYHPLSSPDDTIV
jgi:hypothetical protein